MSAVEVVADVALIAGASMSMFAGLAVLRFPNTPARVHAATKPQVLGIMLLMLGLGLRLGTWAVVGQLVLIVILQFLTAPVSAHLVVREAYRSTSNDASHPEADAHDAAEVEARSEADRAAEAGAGAEAVPEADVARAADIADEEEADRSAPDEPSATDRHEP